MDAYFNNSIAYNCKDAPVPTKGKMEISVARIFYKGTLKRAKSDKKQGQPPEALSKGKFIDNTLS